ncbi:hypothetical protein VP01_2866g1 [Puccinia sorghi]|uniref:UspA domain-containing protein n=1 Tax=Puccinia sorghi TaxID=27349 RepID=A0A0L6V2N0_9BASI|nr:hypothetical protein VP01_2866g1 [Puccinia sorghi]
MKFHKRVPSFSFTSFSFNSHSNNNEQQSTTPPQSHSQPSSPSLPQFEVQPAPLSATVLPSNPSQSLAQQQLQQPPTEQPLRHTPRHGSITLLLSPDDPLRFIVQDSTPNRKRSGSLIEQSRSSPPLDHPDHLPGGRRRSSFAESFNQGLSTLASVDRGRISSANPLTQSSSHSASGRNNHFTRQRKRLSYLFNPLSYYASNSRSPSPANRSGALRLTHSAEPTESDRESNPDPSNLITPQIDLPSSSEDESDSNNSNSDRSSESEPEFSDSEAQTILANTNANASSITPIDYLQKSNQPIPFIDQAPNITSPPPLPISFAPTDPRSLSNPIIPLTKKSSTTSRHGSLRRRTSTPGPRQDLKLAVSRPIYQKNRCTITIEHGDWLEVAKKAERTRFYVVACDLSDESKYAIEWTIGTVLRQGDECLVIMIIETDSKCRRHLTLRRVLPRRRIGRRKSGTKKTDRRKPPCSSVKVFTALLERTGLHAKVTCQAIHGKNAKHMLVDCIDFLEPNLVIVGRRGITSSKGSLMGSVSHYLVQKSSVPVMVARRRLRTLPKVYKKKSGVVPTAEQQRQLNQARIEKSTTILAEPLVDNKRLSVVSEEADIIKLNLQDLRMTPEKPKQESNAAVDLDKGERNSQRETTDREKEALEEEPNPTQSQDEIVEQLSDDSQDVERHVVQKQKQFFQESLAQASLDRQEDSTLTSQPVSFLEPVDLVQEC